MDNSIPVPPKKKNTWFGNIETRDEALKVIDTKRFRIYPVVENGRLIGLVTKKDIVHTISDNLKFFVSNQQIANKLKNVAPLRRVHISSKEVEISKLVICFTAPAKRSPP